MNLIIDHTREIQSICDEFQLHFPYLMLEFYSKSHKSGEGTSAKYQLKHHITISEAQEIPKNGVMRITPEMTVEQLENIFEEIFGLHVQLFRLSGKIKIQTINTDNLTLAEQNEMGMRMAETNHAPNEVDDYHEQL